MLTTLAGIVRLVKPLQPANAPLPMLVTPAEIMRLVKPLHQANAHVPMLVTPAGIVRLVKPLQPANAPLPMLVIGSPKIVPGIVTSPPKPVYHLMVTASLAIDHRKSPDV
jgi:hypothetical protein